MSREELRPSKIKLLRRFHILQQIWNHKEVANCWHNPGLKNDLYSCTKLGKLEGIVIGISIHLKRADQIA